jgi:hypothetical protein
VKYKIQVIHRKIGLNAINRFHELHFSDPLSLQLPDGPNEADAK